jgi:predicted MPP superfamily phosphohydrolase
MPWFLRMTLTMFPLILLIQLYILLGLRYSLKEIWVGQRKKWNMLFWVLLIFFNLFPIIILCFDLLGQVYSLFIFNSELTFFDFFLTFPYWWGFVSSVELLPYFILIDILFIFLKRKKEPFAWSKALSYTKIILMLFIFTYVGIRIYFDTYQIRVAENNIQMENLPEAFDGLKVVLIGDIQVDRYTQQNKLQNLSNKLKKSDYDLVFFSGDLVTSGQRYIDLGLHSVCSFSAEIGKFACLGDHDFWANPRRVSRGMTSCDWTFLQNEHKLLHWKDHSILITGITEIYSRKMSPRELSDIMDKAPAANLKILLLHQPSPLLIEEAVKKGYHLVLAGHTHGGQIQFRPFGITLTTSMLETPYYSGIYRRGNTFIAVTNGIGLTLAPVRYHASAEINVLHLTSAKSD